MAQTVPARFEVKAVSRHPSLGPTYYSPVTHTFSEEYLNPSSYGILVDAFPGMVLYVKLSGQPGPVINPLLRQDIYKLRLPEGTNGYEFSIKGTPAPEISGAPTAGEFNATVTKPLPSLTGIFPASGHATAAWNWRVEVPGPGTYQVSVRILNRTGGAGTAKTKTLVLRDLLVVSIGDSAAAGQGNPDIPGTAEGFDTDHSWWEIFLPVVTLYKLTREALEWTHNKLKMELTTFTRAGGLTIAMDPEPVWLEPKAYRSLRSASAVAARLLEDPANGTVITFLPFGRSGADIPSGLLTRRIVDHRSGPIRDHRSADGWIGGIGQVEEVARTIGKRPIDALLIYIGVNDMGVASSLEKLILDDNDLLGHGSGDDTANRLAVKARGVKNLAALPAKFQKLADALKVLTIRHVYLIEYPTGLFDKTNGEVGGGCGVFTSAFDLDLTPQDAGLIKWLAEQLNGVLKAEVEKPGRDGWFFVTGIAEQFSRRGYCVGEDRFFVQAEESLAVQGDTEGTIHPNPAGVKVIAECIRMAVKQNTIDVPRPSEVPTPGWLEPVLSVMMR